MFYICKYCSKNPYKRQRVLALLYQAQEEINKYGTKATDAHEPARRAKQILQKLLNKTTMIEVSDQQVAAALLGYKSYLASHTFKFVYPWEALQWYHSRNNDNGVMDLDHRLEVEAESGAAVLTSHWIEYLYRGAKLLKLSFYEYAALIGTNPLSKYKKDTPKSSTRSRRPNATFLFEAGCAAAKCKFQIIMSRPCIPRISGTAPPEYPGNAPVETATDCERELWEANAKEFVEFYTLLFVPIDMNGVPIDEDEGEMILPWTGEKSWHAFWRMMGSWNPDPKENAWHQWCNRSRWRVVRNMIDNLRQCDEERSIVTAWRHAVADGKKECDSKHGQRWRFKRGDDDNGNHHQMLMDGIIAELRARHCRSLTKQQEEKKKVIKYVKAQLNAMMRLEPNEFPHAAEAKTYPEYNVADCRRLQTEVDALGAEKEPQKSQGRRLLPKKGKLHDEQRLAVDKMKQCLKDNPQMLAFLHGPPGSRRDAPSRQTDAAKNRFDFAF